MKKMTFATPAAFAAVKDFGCATQRFAHTEKTVDTYEKPLQGIVLSGSYAQVLEDAKHIANADATVVVFGNAGGENRFLADLQNMISCPMVGGGAAFTDTPGLIPGRGEVAVFFVQDDRYTFQTQTQCIHEDLVEECSLTLQDARTIIAINGCDAKQYLDSKKNEKGLATTDFEHLTLTDKAGVNAHLSCVDGIIKSGRDLQERMDLRYVPHQAVYDRIRNFYDDPDAIIFGCAGLGGLLDKPLHTKNLGLFLFGEVCTVAGKAEFGNLMLSKLIIKEKH